MLGNLVEAKAEWARIASPYRDLPEVLQVRWQICAAAKEWQTCLELAETITRLSPLEPFGWIHQAFALHELKQTEEAYRRLAAVTRKFPKEAIIPYNLACYACQMGKLSEARRWLKNAIDIGGKQKIKGMARNDPDLVPLRQEIEED